MKYNVNPPNPRIFTLQAESESSSKFRPKTYRIKKFRNSKAKFFRNNNNNSVVQGNQSPNKYFRIHEERKIENSQGKS